MTTTRTAATLLTLTVLTAASGAQCHRRDVGTLATYGPRVLSQNPTLGDVIQVVNDNSSKIRSLFTTDATLTVPDAPSLRASLAMERPKRLRLRAETALTGPELDVGSNDELFWFWIRRSPPPTVYFCRHDKFADSVAKQFVPIEPQWLLDAICAASFDPALQHSPPVRNTNGRLEVRTFIPTATGTMSRTTVVDEARGWVMEQHLYDEQGTLLASALTGRHWRDPASGAVVPQEIEIRGAANQFSLKFDVRQWTVNSIPADPTQLFTMPTVPGWNVVDLGDPNLRFGAPSTTPQVGARASQPASVPAVSAAGAYPNFASNAPVVGSPMGPLFMPPAGSTAPTSAGGLPVTSGASPPAVRRY